MESITDKQIKKNEYISNQPTTPIFPQRKFPFRVLDQAFRRLFDILVSAAGLFFLSPLFLFIAILIKRDSPGPIHYWGSRVGQGGKVFKILKFRTMYETPRSHAGPRVTAQGDRRITPIGGWLRDTKLNELPQLWNVLKGDMSLVGPRPEDPDFVKQWPPELRSELLAVRPGITSPASIVYRNEEALLVGDNPIDEYLRSILPGKLRLDSLYLRSRTVLSDLDVIFWTLVVLIPQVRRQPIPEHRLYWGPLAIFVNRFALWTIVDFLVALLAVGTAGVVWRLGSPLHIGWPTALGLALALALLFSLVNSLLGLHKVYWRKAAAVEALDLGLSSGIVTTGLVLVSTLPEPPVLPGTLIATSGLLAFMGFVVVRYRERVLTGFATRWLAWRGGVKTLGERVLVVGAGDLAQFGLWLLRKSDLGQAFSVVGMVDDNPRKMGLRVDGCPVLGATADIPELVRQHDVGVVMFSISRILPADRQRILALCAQTNAHLVMIPDIMNVIETYFSIQPKAVELAAGHDTGIPPRLMRHWLQDLDAHLSLGDVAGARDLIQSIRSQLDQDK